MGFFDSLRRKLQNEKSKPLSAESTEENVGEDKPLEGAPSQENGQAQLEDVKQDDAGMGALEEPRARDEGAQEQEDLSARPGEKGLEPDWEDRGANSEETEQDSTMPTVKRAEIKTMAEKKPVTHAVGETKVLAIINQKGGVGKSTTAINLSAALGEQGKAVLVVDLDPQGNTTSGLGVDKSQVQHDVYEVLLDGLSAEDAIIPDVCEGLDLLPATIDLAGAEVELVTEMAREMRLKNALSALRGLYDYVFIDCPPALGLLTINALVAADKLLIPIQCEFYALEGVTKLLDSMNRVKNALNPTLDTFGVLLTMYDSRTMLSKQVANEVRKYFGAAVFDTIIPRTVRLSEAPSFGQPITEYDPSGRGAEAYVSLAKEVMERG